MTTENGLTAEPCFFCQKTESKQCKKCQKYFCIEHASKITSNFCQDCFKDLTVISEKFTKTTEEYDAINDETYTETRVSRRIRMDGPDYVWHTQWIHLMNDAELSVAFEFHKFMVSLIETERDVRKVKKAQKESQESKEYTKAVGIKKTTETKVKKEMKSVDLVTKFIKMGMTKELAEQMAAIANKGA